MNVQQVTEGARHARKLLTSPTVRIRAQRKAVDNFQVPNPLIVHLVLVVDPVDQSL